MAALTGLAAIVVVSGFLYLRQDLGRIQPQAAANPPACQLPVLSASGPGYLDPSTGHFRAESPANAPNPSLPGPPGHALSYDLIQKRWLPVDRRSVTPDGGSYAY